MATQAWRYNMKVGNISLGLRGRILLLLLFAAGFRGVVMVDYLLDQRDRDIAEARRTLAVHAVRAGSELATRIDGAHQLLFGLAHAPELDVVDRAACSAFLAGVLKRYPQYTGILTVRPNGQLHCDSLQTGRELNLTDRAYFRQASAGSALAVEPAFGRLTGTGVMQTALASRDATGQVRFVLLASVDLDRVAKDVLAERPYADTSLTILDRAGTVLAARSTSVAQPSAIGSEINSAIIGKPLADTALGRFALDAKPGNTADFTGPFGVQRVWAASTLPGELDTGVKLILGVPRELVVADAASRASRVVWGIVAATLVIVALGLALAEWGIRKPLARITAVAARLGRGDLSARIGAPYAGGELGELMQSLDRSAEASQSQQMEIRRFSTQMEELVRIRTAELEAVNAELKAFSYSIAHDLRQPLISMNGYATLIRKSLGEGLPADASHYLGRMAQGVQQVSELADAMVSLAHLSRAQLVRQALDLSALAESAASACRDSEPARAARIDIQQDVKAVGAPALVKLVLHNLMDNAWKFSRSRETTVISFSASKGEDGSMVYCVKDNGVGFDMAYAGKLFNAFHRLHSPADFAGTGIGLANVHMVITRHGGRIWAEATPQEGAAFYFTLGA
jgi:signal transduction histidine kinase